MKPIDECFGRFDTYFEYVGGLIVFRHLRCASEKGALLGEGLLSRSQKIVGMGVSRERTYFRDWLEEFLCLKSERVYLTYIDQWRIEVV